MEAGVRQQDQSARRGVQWVPVADLGDIGNRASGGQPLDHEGVAALENVELRVLAGGRVQILHERHRGLAQAERTGRPGRDLPKSDADMEPAVAAALQQSHFEQLGDNTINGRYREP